MRDSQKVRLMTGVAVVGFFVMFLRFGSIKTLVFPLTLAPFTGLAGYSAALSREMDEDEQEELRWFLDTHKLSTPEPVMTYMFLVAATVFCVVLTVQRMTTGV